MMGQSHTSDNIVKDMAGDLQNVSFEHKHWNSCLINTLWVECSLLGSLCKYSPPTSGGGRAFSLFMRSPQVHMLPDQTLADYMDVICQVFFTFPFYYLHRVYLFLEHILTIAEKVLTDEKKYNMVIPIGVNWSCTS